MTNLKQSEFVSANSLEHRLVEAAKDPGARPAFYRELLESDLLVLGFTNSGGGDGHFVAQIGDTVSIAHWTGQDGEQFIPVFSSMERLREAISHESRGGLPGPTSFLTNGEYKKTNLFQNPPPPPK